ncbi:ABC transporter permease [Dactylosporangium sp. CS-033363]|uniref:ABC transporter permease n=1 Tax=Dactylosporangium sp. CS-033363 TaxID=3239935 RepID=UPI003D8E90E8
MSALAPPLPGAVSDTFVLTGRSLRHWIRQPQLMLLSTVQPVMLVLLFTQVFGGAVDTPGIRYVDYLLPGVLVQTVAWDSTQTAVGIAADLGTRTVERFRSLPMSPVAALAGRTLADLCRTVFVCALMTGTAALIGFRVHGGAPAAVAAFALVCAFGFAMSWLFALIGLMVRGAEAALAASFVWVFPLMFASNALVPTGSMPAWLRGFAEHQPISQVVGAARALLLGEPAGRWLLPALAWTAGALLLAVPLAVRRYYRAT